MKNALRVARKEFAGFFSSPIAFIFLGAFLVITLFVFFWVETFFSRNIADVRPMFEWMPLLLIFLVSSITMRMGSEDRRAGTLEFLLTMPVKTHELVLGKFLACMGLVVVALLMTVPLPITVSLLGPLDLGPPLDGYPVPGRGLHLHRPVRQRRVRQPDHQPDPHRRGLRLLLFTRLGGDHRPVRQQGD